MALDKINFKKWIKQELNVKHIGKVATFYIPVKKLNKEVRGKIHDFFVNNYYAYTHETSKIHGFWSKDDEVIKDKHERYEVSFKGQNNLKKFVKFLSSICYIIKEHSIYLTIGEESFLIHPRKASS
jgi:endonuclease I